MKKSKWGVLAMTVMAAVTMSMMGCASITGATLGSGPAKTVYGQGQDLDANGLTANVTYSNGKVKLERISASKISGYDKHSVGTQTLTASTGTFGGGPRVTFEVRVVPILSLSVATPPSKTKYLQGESFNPAGLVVRGNWEEIGSGNLPASSYTVSGYDADTGGTQTITVAAEGQTAGFTVTVMPLVALSIKSPAAKTSYFMGDSLDLGGLVLNATYMDGNKPVQVEVKARDAKVSGFDSKSEGPKVVTLTVSGFSVTYAVVVAKRP